MRIFDSMAHRRNLARRPADVDDFVRAEVTDRLIDRLQEVRRSFSRVLELGGGGDELATALDAAGRTPELHVAMVPGAGTGPGKALRVVADEEWLPFGQAKFDAALAVMGLHWVDDLPGTLAQLRWSLVPDGLLLVGFPGGETLHELRWSLTQAELEVTGGAHARVSPFIDVRDAGALLQRAGFALPVVDCDRLTVRYAEPMRLLVELRRLGAANALRERSRAPLRRDVLARALEIYRQEFGSADGSVPATLDLLFMIGWNPHASQPQPKRRGSATTRLAEALRTPERGS